MHRGLELGGPEPPPDPSPDPSADADADGPWGLLAVLALAGAALARVLRG